MRGSTHFFGLVVASLVLAVPPAVAQPVTVLSRVEPRIPPSPRRADADLIVLVDATVGPDGSVVDARATLADRLFAPAAVDAVRAWRFRASVDAPVTVPIGINFARSEQSGTAAEAVAVGGKVKVPRAVSSAAAVLPREMQPAGDPPGALIEMTVDAGGVPIDATPAESVDALTPRAVDAALHWRFEPDRKVPRRLLKVSVPFEREVSFGPPRAEWPAPPRHVPLGSVTPPRKIVHVPPVYPRQAQGKRIQGTVAMEALIGTDGSVEAAVVVRAVPLLNEAALEAVRQWKFMPTLVDGKPTTTVMTVTVSFALQGGR